MRNIRFFLLALVLAFPFMLSSCADPEPLQPEQSIAHVDGVSADDAVAYFTEVCLGAEYAIEGDSSALQKWTAPVSYFIHGDYTDADRSLIESFVCEVNGIEGFPGLIETAGGLNAQMNIYFCSESELSELTGIYPVGGEYLDGAVRIWADYDEIYSAIVCCRSDASPELRASVIVEELYNSLGPIHDTELREDSVIYQYGSEVLAMSEIDLLLLRLLYNPAMSCGMDASQCETVIRELYS